MTIRDYIKRRALWNWALLMIIMLTAGLATALAATWVQIDMKTAATVIALSAFAITLCRQMHIK